MLLKPSIYLFPWPSPLHQLLRLLYNLTCDYSGPWPCASSHHHQCDRSSPTWINSHKLFCLTHAVYYPSSYDLVVFVDDTHPCPPPTLTTANNPTPNPVYSLWVRQDQLILNVIIDSITPTLIPFIATATTSQVAWTTLLNTYVRKAISRSYHVS